MEYSEVLAYFKNDIRNNPDIEIIRLKHGYMIFYWDDVEHSYYHMEGDEIRPATKHLRSSLSPTAFCCWNAYYKENAMKLYSATEKYYTFATNVNAPFVW